MAKRYSKIYSYDYSENMKNQKFRYNFDSHNLENVCIPDKEMLDEIKDDALNCKLDWMRIEAQENLKSYEETGYVVIAAEGLSERSWEEDKEYYMDMMCESTAFLISEAIEEFAPEVSKKEEGKKMGSANDTSLASALNELSWNLDPYDYMDNFNSLEEGLQYFSESLNNQEQTKAILEHLRESQEETPEIWGPKELEVLRYLEKYASQQFPEMFAISEEDITKLVNAGDWHIDEEDHERFAAANVPRVTGSIGYVSFGNYFYDFRCLDYSPESKNFAVDICELRPAEDIGQTTHKFLKDGMPYTFEAIDVDDLEEKYLPGLNAYVIMERNDYNSDSLENFKRDVVKALATGGVDHQKPLIDASLTDEYLSLKEPGTGFPQYYEKQKKILEHLQKYECNPREVYSFLPEDTKQLIHRDKLTPEQIDTLGNYYEHFMECYSNTCLDFIANKRMIVRKMVNDGLSDSKISMINDSMFDRFERFTSSVPKPYFKKIISDLIKETRAANAARWTDKSKNFGK